MTEETYVLFAQCNLWKSPNASTELGLYLNKAMSHYRYVDKDRAGFFLNKDDPRDSQDENYKKRLRNVGVQMDDNDNVVSKPTEAERHKFKSTYKKAQERIARESQQDPNNPT